MTTKREAAVRGLATVVRMVLGNPEFREKHGYSVGLLEAALRDLDAAPDDVEARTEAQKWVENFTPQGLWDRAIENDLSSSVVPNILLAIRDDLRALAASVKERR